MSKTELKVIALIDSSLSTIFKGSTDAATQPARRFVSASSLAGEANNSDKLNRFQLQNSLTELASRGLLIPDGATRTSKTEEYYYVSQAFLDLVDRAKEAIESVGKS
ncbi:MAG: hypothetical protein ACLPID_12825 [Beijerinckiaceae bacterium]